jgi:bifunctional DNA-binding transcriptional regulator/antitoxin component of YhaV-PrlF toxin-antitoxin module
LVEIRKVDSQGRLILPSDWRAKELPESGEVYIVKQKGYLKVIPRRAVDLQKFFDKADLGIDSIGNWNNFERKLAEKEKRNL